MSKPVFAEILTIGDEILYGQITNTNSQWMSQALDQHGFKVVRQTTVSDREEAIISALDEALQRAEIVLMTGGLGPTKDDITKESLARFFSCELELNKQALTDITDYFTMRGRAMTDRNRRQAWLPAACTYIKNGSGTAPAMWFEHGGKVIVSMPGVPHEMHKLMQNEIIPRLLQYFRPPVIIHRLIKTAGIGESWLADKISDWEAALPDHVRLAYLPHFGMVRLRLTGTGTDRGQLEQEIEEEIARVKPLISEYIYGYDEDELEAVLGKRLTENKLSLVTAESCTAGFVAHRITQVPGSSAYFKGGMIPYSNRLKEDLLGVNAETLKAHGAVSEPVIREMAAQAKKVMNADIGIATSGIAGPGGGTPEKPVGTVWIAVAWGNHVQTKKLSLTKDRMLNIRLTSVAVLVLLWQELLKIPEKAL